MTQNQIFLSLFIGVVVLYWVYSKSMYASRFKIDPEKAKKRLDTEKGIILLDVRTSEEHRQNHIPKSTLIPLNSLAKDASKRLPDKQANIIVYCQSGNRSKAATKILTKQGYTNVSDLGGIIRWPFKTTGK